ncbi:MAG: cell division protein FtsA, partial [Bacteroidota bacterium]
TGVGLVLAGFKAIDERNSEYLRRKSGQANQFVRKERQSAFSFKGILEKTKKILIDDFNEKEY